MNKEEGWRQCAKGQRTTQFCGLLEEAVRAEREACAKKEAMNKLSPQNELTLWVGATQYHLGRTTYAVSNFCNLLSGSWGGRSGGQT